MASAYHLENDYWKFSNSDTKDKSETLKIISKITDF